MEVNWLELGEQFAIAHPYANEDFMREEVLIAETPVKMIERTLKVDPWGEKECDWTCWAMAVVLARDSSKQRIAKMMAYFARELLTAGELDPNEFSPLMKMLEPFALGEGSRTLCHDARKYARQYEAEAKVQFKVRHESLGFESPRTMFLVAATYAMRSMKNTDIARVAEEAAGFLKAVAHTKAQITPGMLFCTDQ